MATATIEQRSTGAASFSLDVIEVASPCSASWDAMRGSDAVRFCEVCKLNVYNLSGMSRGEAEALVLEREGRLCVRFYRRADGTVITRDCPIGLRALRRQIARLSACIVAGLVMLTGGVLFGRAAGPVDPSKAGKGPLATIRNAINPPRFGFMGSLVITSPSDTKITASCDTAK